jgi:hypothetical protein
MPRVRPCCTGQSSVRRLQAIGSEVQSNEIRLLRLMLPLEVKAGTAGGGHRWITRRRHQSSVSYPDTWGRSRHGAISGREESPLSALRTDPSESRTAKGSRSCWTESVALVLVMKEKTIAAVNTRQAVVRPMVFGRTSRETGNSARRPRSMLSQLS